MANTYNHLEDSPKAEEMYRLALDDYAKSLGKDKEDTKECARSLAGMLLQGAPSNEKSRALVKGAR